MQKNKTLIIVLATAAALILILAGVLYYQKSIQPKDKLEEKFKDVSEEKIDQFLEKMEEMEQKIQLDGTLTDVDLDKQTLTLLVKWAFNPLTDMSDYQDKSYSFLVDQETQIFRIKMPGEKEMDQFLQDKNKFKEENTKLIGLADLKIGSDIAIGLLKEEVEQKTDNFLIKRIFWFIQ